MRITSLDVERFTCGDCHLLARAIHELTGWPICAFDAFDGPDIHAFVRTPSGKYLDIEGVHAPHTFKRNWHERRVRRISWAALAADWGDAPRYGRYSVVRARRLAPLLAARAGWSPC